MPNLVEFSTKVPPPNKTVAKKKDKFKAKLLKSNKANTAMALRGIKQTGYSGKSQKKDIPNIFTRIAR